MTIGICKLCGEEKELQRSHVIGKTIFSSILRTSIKNVATQFEFGSNKIIETNDTWYTRLLCSECERFFNEEYENYSIAVLRRKRKEIEIIENVEGVTFTNLNVEKIVLFAFSIYWRASHSEHHAYADSKTFPLLDKVLKATLKKDIDLIKALFKARIRILKDDTKLFEEHQLKLIIFSPFITELPKGFKYTMIFEGYLIELYFSTLNFKNAYKLGFLINENEIFIPYVNILSQKEIVETLKEGGKLVEKMFNGISPQ
ncbi:hypothetical protein BA71_02143 [Acinetobacter baumannii LAC-4]|uniref:hypothetical protein n=1 Tax=Acinetobacter baumannii TaxID=470 RepID=UPI00044BDECB|nr:hypothetical protein [Acinetobacter baumannii]AIY36963.1 hypothetical protein ABLAC_16080 [Acinetobacter baumannii LAC-4]APO59510.1 hypothetical protein BBX32_13650 [Acinetobacter baumannii]EZF15070.1 hypothetical protein BA71_02143 [Acinetobacter baumannii LAC-4]